MRHSLATPSMPQRVVVIGAGGFVGAAISRRMRAAHIPVLDTTRSDLDLLTPEAGDRLASLLLPGDAVVLVAAIAPCKSAAMLADNLAMVRAMVEGLKRGAPAHVINISSDAVYPDEPTPLHEGVTPAPDSLHGVMHLARELCLTRELTVPMAHVRPTLIYGLDDPHNGYGPNRFRRLASSGAPIILFGEGEEQRDHVWIDDVAELVVRLVMHRSTGALNIATGAVYSFRQVAELAVEAAGTDASIVSTARVGPLPHNGYRPFDPQLTSRLFPDFAYLPLPDGVARVQADASAQRGADVDG
jgi:nucleoside-diphosphate-sugar epimerase